MPRAHAKLRARCLARTARARRCGHRLCAYARDCTASILCETGHPGAQPQRDLARGHEGCHLRTDYIEDGDAFFLGPDVTRCVVGLAAWTVTGDWMVRQGLETRIEQPIDRIRCLRGGKPDDIGVGSAVGQAHRFFKMLLR